MVEPLWRMKTLAEAQMHTRRQRFANDALRFAKRRPSFSKTMPFVFANDALRLWNPHRQRGELAPKSLECLGNSAHLHRAI